MGMDGTEHHPDGEKLWQELILLTGVMMQEYRNNAHASVDSRRHRCSIWYYALPSSKGDI